MERNTVIGKKQWSVVSGAKRWSVAKKEATDNGQRTTDKREKGFTILELMIAMFILIILLSVALPTYQRSIQQARETVLKENLFQMRRAIDQYTADKGKLPESLDNLVEEQYLREKPVEPLTEKAEWKEIAGENLDPNDTGSGIKDVKSMTEGEDSDGKKYEDY